MERRNIHPQGPVFSRIVAGAWRWHNVSPEIVERLALAAIDEGITSFDHADIYGDHCNEETFGRALAKNPAMRNQIELITKCDIKFASAKRPATRVKHYDTSQEHIIWAAENSLKMLRTDHIDLLLIHRPDPLMDPHEVAEAFGKLKQQGKVLHFGVSNFTPSQFRMLQQHLPFPLVTNQIEISLSQIDPFFNGDLDLMLELGVSPMAWSPLGGGTLPVDERTMFGMAGKYNASYTQMAIAWLLRHPAKIFPVIGTTQPERIREAAKSTDIDLDRQDWFEMLRWVMGKDLP
ncbi:MAG: aldo/keto reductase [Bacteroidetes bacterium]|nr:aldo/keto reductase [Bacteroidota bacterium]MBS1539016.1 aldo/keto reductase [Bacteroidota bacterium]